MTTADSLTQQYQVCIRPSCIHKGQPQPIDNFYTRRGGTHEGECKDCKRERSRNQVRFPKDKPVHPTEAMAIGKLREMGIPALPGKAYAANLVDVLAWGCVHIEVKYSSLKVRHHKTVASFQFGLSPLQVKRGLLAELVFLICDFGVEQTYHVFPAHHPVFFINGHLKTGIVYVPNYPEAGFRHGKSRVVMTDDLMKQYQDRWDLIEKARLEFSEQLRNQ